MTDDIARILRMAGLEPETADPRIVEIATRLRKQFYYADAAAREPQRIVRGPVD